MKKCFEYKKKKNFFSKNYFSNQQTNRGCMGPGGYCDRTSLNQFYLCFYQIAELDAKSLAPAGLI